MKRLRLLTSLVLLITLFGFASRAGAQATFVSTGTGGVCNSVSNCTVTIGTHSDGDAIYFAGESNSMNGSALPSGGGTPLQCPVNHPRSSNSGDGQFFCYKVWHTGDPTSYNFVATSGNPSWNISALDYSGEDQALPAHEVNTFRLSAAASMNPSRGTLIVPGVSPSYLNETRVAIVRTNGGAPTTPTGMTTRSYYLNGGLTVGLGVYDLALSTTTPTRDLSAGNPDGSSSYHNEVTSFLIPPASPVSGTRYPVPYLACYGDVGHIADTNDISNCLPQDGDLVQTCMNADGIPMQGATAPSHFNNPLSRGFTLGLQANSGVEAHCNYGYWHTGDPTTFAWGNPGGFNYGGVVITWFIHRVNGGTAYVGQATTSPVAQASNSVVSNALTTTQPYTKWIEALITDGAPTFTPPSGSVSFIQGQNGQYQNFVERDLTSTG